MRTEIQTESKSKENYICHPPNRMDDIYVLIVVDRPHAVCLGEKSGYHKEDVDKGLSNVLTSHLFNYDCLS
jgi:hypothetical protein